MPAIKAGRVAIIGGGPSGVTAAKFLRAENAFSTITVYEQRSKVGGIWNPDAWSPKADATSFPSSIYETMEPNIPSETMQFSSMPFPTDCSILPDVKQTLAFLEKYSEDVLDIVHLRTQVLDVKPFGATPGRTRWQLKLKDLAQDKTFDEVYDAVVVANGRYDTEFFPDIPGLNDWRRAFPDTVMHSKMYRSSKVFKDKKIIIVGFSPSGVDLAMHIEPVCTSPLLISQRSSKSLSPGSLGFAEGKLMVPEIIKFDTPNRSITFANGRVEKDVDKVVFCTGYDHHYPFLSSMPGFKRPGGHGNTNTHQHIFYTPAPTLAFLLLPLRAVAFPFAESQAAVIARVFSSRLALPSAPDMEEWVSRRKSTSGTDRGYHKMSFPADANYMDEMYEWALTATPKLEMETLPRRWNERDRWLRKHVHEIRRAAEARGVDRFGITRVEELGFVFERAADDLS